VRRNRKRIVTYCTRDIDYPERLFLGFVWVYDFEHRPILIPASQLSITPTKVLNYLNEIQDAYKTHGAEIINQILIIPLTFQKLVPLKKDHWLPSKIDSNIFETIFEYADAIKEYEDTQVLVATQGVDKSDSEKFAHTAVMSRDTSEARLDKIIVGSETYVDPTSKHAAVYTMEPPVAINPTNNRMLISTENKAGELLYVN
jgi:hypothetical protein